MQTETVAREKPLAGHVAIVTGAARGIGRAYALRLASLGAALAVVDVDLHSYSEFPGEAALMTADSTVEEARTLGSDAIGVEADVGDRAAMDAMARHVMNEWGRIDVVVCNAGGGSGKITENSASELDLDQLDLVLRRNLYGTIHTCMAVVPAMKQQRSGSIITVSSTEGLKSLSSGSYAHYCVAKAGIIMYTRCLAQELGPFGIRANAVAPGFIGTGRIMPMIADLGGDDAVAEIALRRIGTPDECAKVVEFLATDLSSYVTGHVIPVEGGWIAGGI
jgi:3-oxoacyl-[acyl-carrier protein] reductase